MKYYNSYFFYLFIYILLITILSVNNFFAIPFKTINLQYEESQKDYIYKIYTNNIYINITLGTPKQTIMALLKMEKDEFYIHKDGFFPNESSSYINLDKDSKSIISSSENKSTDIFYFPYYNSYDELSNIKNIKENSIHKSFKMNFIFMNYVVIWNSNKTNPGEIGLQYKSTSLNSSITFVKSLHESKEIKNYIFSFIFNNNSNIFSNEGFFIIGEELTDKENEKDNIKYTKAADISGLIKWNIFFDEIYSYSNGTNNSVTNININKTIINRNHKAQLIIDKPYIIGTDEYESFILKNFFQYLIDEKVCFKKSISGYNSFYVYYCDNSSELFISQNFPDLHIFSRELGETFILKKNDLFFYDINYNNASKHFCYFMVWFSKSSYAYEKKYWCLGIPFFKKYRFSFDYEKKLIGFYNQSFHFEPNKQNISGKDKNNLVVLKIIVIFVLLLIAFFIVGFIIKKLTNKKKRKKKLNELVDEDEENYDYKDKDQKGNLQKDNNIN